MRLPPFLALSECEKSIKMNRYICSREVSCERSFSALCRLKTCCRWLTGSNRLNGLASETTSTTKSLWTRSRFYTERKDASSKQLRCLEKKILKQERPRPGFFLSLRDWAPQQTLLFKKLLSAKPRLSSCYLRPSYRNKPQKNILISRILETRASKVSFKFMLLLLQFFFLNWFLH